MENNARELTRETRRIIGLQVVIGVLVAAGFFVAGDGLWDAGSGLYGGLISVIGTFLLGRRVERAGKIAQQNPGKGMQSLYIGAVQRFVLVLALLGFGLVLFKFDPLAMVVGLCLTQLAYTLGMHKLKPAQGD